MGAVSKRIVRESPYETHTKFIKRTIIFIFTLGLVLLLFLLSPSKADSTRTLLVVSEFIEPNTIEIKLAEDTLNTDKLFERIAFCESSNNPEARNSHSTAGGRFQFIIGSWDYYGEQLWGEELVNKNRFDYDDNTELAWFVYTTVGTSPWNASKHCWDNML